jgi:hypothetical protein
MFLRLEGTEEFISANFFKSQSWNITDRGIKKTTVPLILDTIGIVNGYIDILTQMSFYHGTRTSLGRLNPRKGS